MDNNFIDIMIRNDGSKKYAYVTLLMILDIYASPAIILAESIRKLGSLADLVVLLDKGVSKDTEDLLKKFYDKIILIDLIEIKHENQTQKYILSKLEGLKLLEYEKIILIDIDSIIFNNIDSIFNKQEPSCIFIENILNTGLILLKPNLKKYNQMIKLISNSSNNIIKELEQEDKPLIYTLKKLYSNINKLDSTILSPNKYENTDGIQYSIDKPFLMSSEKTIESRVKLNHFKIWFGYFLNILNKYPDIKLYNCLKETINISKYFLSGFGRYLTTFKSIRQINNYEQVYKLYGIKQNKNLEYYHMNISKEYDNDNINIILNDYTITNFIEYLKNKTNLLDYITNYTDIKTVLSQVSDDKLLDYILSEYIKIYSNVFIVLIINEYSDNNKKYKLPTELKNNLIFVKDLELYGIVLKNILFNIYQTYVYDERIKYFSIYQDYTRYIIQIQIYQTVYPLEFLNNNFENNKFLNNIFIFGDSNSKTRIGSVFLNSNSLKRFTSKKINWINNNKIEKKTLLKLLKFQTLKKWMYNTWNGNELSQVIIVKDNPLIVIDNNKHNPIEIKKIIKNKLEFVEIIFSKSSQYKNIMLNWNDIISNISNPTYYWELDGIKFNI